MKLRILCASLLAGASLSFPAAAQGLSQWGVWSDGAQLGESKQQPSFLGAIKPPLDQADGGGKPNISPKAPEIVAFNGGDYDVGTIIIDTSGRRLYYTISETQAYRYPIAVGKDGFTWTGIEKVSKVVDWPEWIPPKEMRARKPSLPVKMSGGIRNPLGVKAIYLGNTLYRIHGTNDSGSIGEAASSGCFRMYNNHVVHLAGLVTTSTTVYVLQNLNQKLQKEEEPEETPAPETPAEAPAPTPQGI